MNGPIRQVTTSFALIIAVALTLILSGCTTTTSTNDTERARERQTTATSLTEQAQKQRYMDQMILLINRTATALDNLSQAADAISNGDISPDDGAVRIRLIRAQLADVRAKAISIVPQRDLGEFHTHYINALGLYMDGCDRVATGLEERDPSLINEGVLYLEDGNTELEMATEELRENLPEKAAVLKKVPKAKLGLFEDIKIRFR